MAHKERHTASKKKGGAVKILLAVVLLPLSLIHISEPTRH